MAANFKLEREQWRLETDMNVPPVETNFQFRTLRNWNIPYDIRNRPNDRKTSKREKPDVHSWSNNLKICSKVTPGIPQWQPNTLGKTIGNTSKQDSIKLHIPAPRDEKHTQGPLNISLPQTSIYESNLGEQNIFTWSKLPHVGIATFGHIRRDKYMINKI